MLSLRDAVAIDDAACIDGICCGRGRSPETEISMGTAVNERASQPALALLGSMADYLAA
jgi:hypothetical protein